MIGQKTKKLTTFTLSRRRAFTGLLFVSPFIVGFVWFYLRGIIMSIQFSLSDMTTQGLGYSLEYVGLKNYRYAFFEHPGFRQTLTSSVVDMVIDVPLIIFFSLFIAIILNQKFRGRTVARAIFFLPVLLNSPLINGVLTDVRNMMIGGVTATPSTMTEEATSVGIGVSYYVELLGDIALPNNILGYIVDAVARINSIVTSSGVQIIIFLAALQSIAPSLYEVAKIEGATPYETFWKITFPMVSPLIVTNMVYTVVDSFQRSGVLDFVYTTMFGIDNSYQMGAVYSLVSMVAVCGILLIATTAVSKRTFYQN
ncbi:MAG: sugar ABC transporter permease [Oscillospiraceae bacterium]|nr:sugar ABC transporter permease [Oscillospiraceae bacterium]